MKKWIKGLAISLPIVTATSCAIAIPIALNHNVNSPSLDDKPTVNPNVILTSEIVQNLFNNEWKNKTEITYDDLKSYKFIRTDAFDNINQHLNFVELPSTIEIIFSDYNNNIVWNNVDKITIKEININKQEQNVYIENNLLIFLEKKLYTNNWVISTISDRTINCEIDFSQLNYKTDELYAIANYFYQQDIFKNVSLIKFCEDNKNIFLPIAEFGISSFMNCNILNKDVVIKLNIPVVNFILFEWFRFGSKTFFNVNVASLKIDIRKEYYLPPVLIFQDDFIKTSNKSLNLSIDISEGAVGISSMKNMSENVTLSITSAYLIIGTASFSGTYQSFNLFVLNSLSIPEFQNAWDVITSDCIYPLKGIDSVNFKLTTNILKSTFDANLLGLNPNQINSIEFIDQFKIIKNMY